MICIYRPHLSDLSAILEPQINQNYLTASIDHIKKNKPLYINNLIANNIELTYCNLYKKRIKNKDPFKIKSCNPDPSRSGIE